MINLWKKDIISSSALAGLCDLHSHILPGVDDGVKSENEALEALSYLESLGIQKVILTPHIMCDYPLNQLDFLKEKFRLLNELYKGSIELSLGAEYMLDNQFEGLLETNELITIFDNYLLVETSYLSAPVNFNDLLSKIHSNGYHIILAHPERYHYMNDSDYDYLKKCGVRFQLNILSVVGAYGRQVQTVAKRILLKGYYDFIGSDLHNLKSFKKEIQHSKLSSMVICKIKSLKG